MYSSDIFRFLGFVKTYYHLLINLLRLLRIKAQAKIIFFAIITEMEIPTGIDIYHRLHVLLCMDLSLFFKT